VKVVRQRRCTHDKAWLRGRVMVLLPSQKTSAFAFCGNVAQAMPKVLQQEYDIGPPSSTKIFHEISERRGGQPNVLLRVAA
jgi:hypothetical protein